MKNKSKAEKLLKVLIDLMWYGGLSASIILILATILFNLAVIGIVKINFPFPAIPIKINNHIYRLGSQYAEVRRIDSIVDEYTGMELAKMLYWSNPYFDDAVKDLYKINFNRMRPVPKDGYHLSQISYDSQINLFPIRYFTHGLVPELVLGLSFLSLIVSLFLIIILYNLRKLFKSSVVGNVFLQENSERFKFIGVYFLLGEFVRVLIFYWINNSVARTEWANNIRQSYTFSLSDINFALLFAGIIFLILAQIFRIGAVLKEENDLTV
ncbi:MAG: DUF2975 domain-containing protein [Melioribacteraceae bacterium]